MLKKNCFHLLAVFARLHLFTVHAEILGVDGSGNLFLSFPPGYVRQERSFVSFFTSDFEGFY